MKKALLIGIDAYPSGNELNGCVEDIIKVKKAIELNGDGSPNFSVRMLPNVQTSSETMTEIEQLFSGDGESALLYFSGHGYVNTTGAEIVLPQNVSVKGNYYRGIQMSTIMDVVNRSAIRNKIIILDCCHSGNIGKYKPQGAVSVLPTGVSILTACREDEQAMEIDGHGLFTGFLCDALNGGAADYCGNITIGGIYAYIDRSFGPLDQRPVFKTNVTEFSPIRRVEPRVPLAVIKELTNLFALPDDKLALDPSFEDSNSPEIKHECIRPYANADNVRKFKLLQNLQSIGFVEPVGEEFMYYAAMNSQACSLTRLGRYYWQLVKGGRI